MRKTFYNKTDVDATRKLVDDALEVLVKEGTVISVATSEVRVKLEGNKYQSAYAAKGLTLQQNDRVVLIRSPRTARWIVIGSYANPQAAGNTSSTSTNALAPSNLTIIPVLGGFLARCTVGVDTPVTLEFEVADDTAETGAVNLMIAGSVLPYVSSTVKSVRVRSVDIKWNKSGWTAWVTATPMTKVALSAGGTNADLSATGAGFLKQATTGANVTVAALASGDIPNLDTSKLTTGQLGQARGGTGSDLSSSSGPGLIQQASANGALTAIKCNFGASSAPSVSDDSSAGYSNKSFWWDQTHSRLYACFSASVGAALWIELTNTAGATSVIVQEQDGTPSVTATEIHVTNGTLTDLGGGVAQLDFGTGGGGSILEVQVFS